MSGFNSRAGYGFAANPTVPFKARPNDLVKEKQQWL